MQGVEVEVNNCIKKIQAHNLRINMKNLIDLQLPYEKIINNNNYQFKKKLSSKKVNPAIIYKKKSNYV